MDFRYCNTTAACRNLRGFGRTVIGALLILTAGCAGLGDRVKRVDLPPGAPRASVLLADLAENDERIQTFRGGGTFILESPEFDAVKKFRGSIRFRRPADLYVQGNHRLTNIPIFKLTSVGSEFLMEFPGSRDDSFYQIEGEQFEDVPFSVSPSDIAREMFLPEHWNELRRRDVRFISFDDTEGAALLEIGPEDEPRRLVELVRVDVDNPRWVVQRNWRLGEGGAVLAETRLEGYHEVDGALFPASVDAWFPTEATRMTFRMRNIRLNTELPEKYFDIHARARELNLAVREPRDGDGEPSYIGGDGGR